MTQADLARATGQTRAAVSLWENGSTKALSAESAIKTAEALNVTVKWLVYGSGRRATPTYSEQALALARVFDVMGQAQQQEVLGYVKYILARAVSPDDGSSLESLLDEFASQG